MGAKKTILILMPLLLTGGIILEGGFWARTGREQPFAVAAAAGPEQYQLVHKLSDQQDKPKPLPPNIVKAWEAAGVTSLHLQGIVPLSRNLYIHTGYVPDADIGLPAELERTVGVVWQFRFPNDGEAGALINLPDPGVPFGLCPGKNMNDMDMKDVARFKSIFSITLSDTEVTDQGLKQLAALKQLRWLHLPKQSTNAGMKELTALKSLQLLHLGYSNSITDTGVQALAGLTNLEALSLADTQVTDAGLKTVATLTNLQALSLQNTQVTDSGVKLLSGLKNLKSLNLHAVQVSDAALKELSTLTDLRSLDLAYTRVGAGGLIGLANLKNLQHLRLTDTDVTDGALKEVGKLKILQWLSLDGCKITDAGLKELAGLKSLQLLDLRSTQVTAAGVAALQRALPNCKIESNPED